MSETKKESPDAVVQYISPRKELPLFSGERDDNVDEWIATLESHLEATNYPKSQRSAFLVEHTKGNALRELRCESLSASSEWSSLVATLRQCYGKRKPKWGDFYGIVQQIGQSLTELSLELRERYAELVPDIANRKPEVLKERMSEAMRELALKDEAGRLMREASDISFYQFVVRLSAIRAVKGGAAVRQARVEEVDEIEVAVREAKASSEVDTWREAYEEEVVRARGVEAKLEELTRAFERLRAQHESERVPRAPMTTPKTIGRPLGNSMRCVRCAGYGHWARECKEFGCRRCHRFGHSERDCQGNCPPQ